MFNVVLTSKQEGPETNYPTTYNNTSNTTSWDLGPDLPTPNIFAFFSRQD